MEQERHGVLKAQKKIIVDVPNVKCLRRMVGVTWMDWVKNVEVCRDGIEIKLAGTVDLRVLRWFGHMEWWMSTVWLEECWGLKQVEAEWGADQG